LATDKAAVLVIDQPRPSQEILELMALGVHGYVSYSEVGELVPAIKSVSQGQFWLKVNAIQSRRTVGPAVGSSDVGSLTDRERAVIVLLQRRLSNKEISTELRISESTVKFHLGNIFSKLGLRDRTSVSEAVRSVALVNHDV
jgi:DNA-binding NarL/FixJ family response regulator